MRPPLIQALLRLLQLAILAALLGGAAASGVEGGATRRGLTFAGVALVAFGLLVALWRAWLRLVAFPSDEYGPLSEDRERYERHLRKVGKASRNLVARWRVQRRMRDSFERARAASDPDRAEQHLERAREALQEWRQRFRAPRGERRALERRYREDWSALRTLRFVNAIQAQLAHARGLKTPRGRARARARARAYLERGLADPEADDELLARLARETGLLREDARAAAPLLAPDARWVGPADEVALHGRRLPGPAWVGTHLPAARGGGPDPALIDPSLPVAARPDRRGADVPGLPRYAALKPRERAALLDWLAAGRPAQDAPRGFPRLVLFALERRLLEAPQDSAEARREVPDLLVELERLSARHPGDRRLVAGARALGLHAALRFPFEVGADEGPSGDGPSGGGPSDGGPGDGGPGDLGPADGELPPRLRLGLARRISAGRPLPAAWARAWLHHATGGALRTPAQRAPEDFERLFRLRYERRHGPGLVAPPAAAALRVVVRPLSPGFAGEAFQARLDLPDPAGCVGVVEELETLADACCEELAGLSRFLGGAGGRAPDLRVLSTLPPELLAWHDEAPLEALRARLRSLEEAPAPRFVATEELVALWPRRGAPSRADSTRFATLLGKLGHGVEPDPRFGGPAWPGAGEVALFPLASDAPRAPSRAYEAAALVVHVAVALAGADRAGADALADPEEDALREHLEASLDLPAAERRRLAVHLAWLRRHPPRLAGLKRRVEGMDAASRDRLADFLLRVACADGVLAPGEVRMLERMYALLGREPAAVHADLHRHSAGAGPRPAASPGAGLALDPARLAQKLAETRRVSALLGDVFADPAPGPEPAPVASSGPTHAGLDVAHSALLVRLVARDTWARVEVEELAQELDLLPDGALEVLNEAAFEAAGAPLWEGEDPLWVDVALGAALSAG